MPEYLAPGVYIEEVSYRSKSIEGVSTTTTGFIGPTRFGPTDIEPDIITSLGEFERTYGDRQQLVYSGSAMHNYMWHATRAFFEEGGKRVHISRVFLATSGTDDGCAGADIGGTGATDPLIQVSARFPGSAGNMYVRFTVRLSQNILSGDDDGTGALKPKVNGLMDRDVVWIKKAGGSAVLYMAESYYDSDTKEDTWRFNPAAGAAVELNGGITASLTASSSDDIRIVTLAITVEKLDRSVEVWGGIPIDPDHERDGSPDGMTSRFDEVPSNLSQSRTLPIVINVSNVDTGLDVLTALCVGNTDLLTQINNLDSSDEDRSVDIELSNGNDGQRPTASEYEGTDDPATTIKTGLKQFEDIEDISIVAAPGSTFGLESSYRASAMTIMGLLISHASRMRYRIAVLDSGNDHVAFVVEIPQSTTAHQALTFKYHRRYNCMRHRSFMQNESKETQIIW